MHQRSDGRWVAVLCLEEIGENGRKRRKYLYGESKKEVVDKLRAFDPAASTAAPVSDVSVVPTTTTSGSPGGTTLGEYLDSWLIAKRLTVEKRTYEYYAGHVRLHLKPRLGNVLLDEITPELIRERLYNALLLERGTSSTLPGKVGVTLGVALSDALAARQIPFHPLAGMKKPKKKHREHEVFSEEQLAAFMHAARVDKHWPFYITMIDTGLRPGELWALRWQDVDLVEGSLFVRRAVEGGQGAQGFKEPKTPKSRRRVVLAPQTLAALRDLYNEKERPAPSALVFANRRGGIMRKSNFYRDSYRPVLHAAGLKPVPLYTLRHTSATLLLLLGESPKVVSERLGHSTTKLTMDTYSHVLPTMQEAAAAKIGGIFSKLEKSQQEKTTDGVVGCQSGCQPPQDKSA